MCSTKYALFVCKRSAASTACAVGSVAGALVKSNASAVPSPGTVTLCVPLVIISITSSNAAVSLVTASVFAVLSLALNATSDNSSVFVFKYVSDCSVAFF